MGSCCRTDGDEMSARLFWGGCGWNELLEERGIRSLDWDGSGAGLLGQWEWSSSGRWVGGDLKVLRKRQGRKRWLHVRLWVLVSPFTVQ